jgi:hypothetical protein
VTARALVAPYVDTHWVHDPSRERLILWVSAPLIGLGLGLALLHYLAWLIYLPLDHWLGQDGLILVEAGKRMAAGAPIYADPFFLYPPAATALGLFLATPGIWFLLAIGKPLLVALIAAHVSRGRPTITRAFVVLTSVLVVPLAQDVFLGNVNTYLVVGVAAVVLWPRRTIAGIAIGLLVATFAKPLLLPFAFWMLVWRPRQAVAAVIAGTALTLVVAIVLGPASYAAWIDALIGGTRFMSASWSLGLSRLGPAFPIFVGLALVVFVIVLVQGSEGWSLRAAVGTGLAMSPYVPLAYLLLLFVPLWATIDGLGSQPAYPNTARQRRLPARLKTPDVVAWLDGTRGSRSTSPRPRPPG